jgi:hypothetical protein
MYCRSDSSPDAPSTVRSLILTSRSTDLYRFVLP